MRPPLLIVVSAPSGAGKSTLCDMLRAERPDIAYSVSCTTREPRGEEVDGSDYHFLSEGEFERRVANREFLEHATVHGYRYGTLRATVRDAMTAGRSVIMDIDVQGAGQIRESLARLGPDDPLRRGFVDVFITPPSLAVLRERLERRGEDSPETIERRLHNAEGEMGRSGEYAHTIVNDDLQTAFRELKSALEYEAHRRAEA
jgi:guanylate kinase